MNDPETTGRDPAETGQRVLVVGANSALARSVADQFAERGATVAGIGLDDQGAEHYRHFRIADCSDPAAAQTAVTGCCDALGGLTTLVLGAGAMTVAPAADTTDEQWRRAIGANLDTVFYPLRAALPRLGAGSAVVVVGSVNGSLAAPWVPGYAAAKAGVEGLVRQVALDYGPRGVRVNAVAPGTFSDDPSTDAAGYPLGRVGRPAEIARAVVFLGTDESSFVTGTTLTVDGGLSIASPAAWLRPDLRSRWLQG